VSRSSTGGRRLALVSVGVLVGFVLIMAWQTWDADRMSEIGVEEPGNVEASPRPPAARLAHPDAGAVRHYAANWAPKGLKPQAANPAGFFEDENFIKGAALGLYMDLPALSYAQMFKEIRALGATHVSLVVAWSIRDIRASRIRPHATETVPDERVRAYIQQAHAAGLKVMLFPIVHVDRRRSGEWRGKLAPHHPDRFWTEYQAFMQHYGKLAQEEDVAILSVGSELLTMESEQARWKAVIDGVRLVYKGKLTYSANWDHFDHVTFWEYLDVAGMTGYFELSDSERPTLKELRETWDAATEVIATYPDRAGLPLVLTEVGYPSQLGSASHPWDYTKRRAPDPHLQYLCYRAMYEAWAARASKVKDPDKLGLDGLFVWNWYGYGGPEDGSYTVRGKPAEAVVRHWFGAPELAVDAVAPAPTPKK
jgi:hypothetical protein